MPRPLLSLCAAAGAAAAVLLATAGAVSAVTAQRAGAPPVSVTITSVSPGFARPGQTVTVSGSIQNVSRAPVSDLTIRLRSSASWFRGRDSLQTYADGFEVADSPVPGAATRVAGALRPKASASWSIRLHVSRIGMTVFGVYPLAAEADSADGMALAADRTFLPYVPGRHSGYSQPRMDVSWIWPLIDKPRQGACAGLLGNGLASSLRPGGRLGGLLAAGRTYSARAHLTWAIDPALLGNAQTMTRQYLVGSNAICQHGRKLPASATTARWLDGLRRATAGQSVFLTPYADVDVAALTRQSMGADLTRAIRLGRTVAGSVLGRSLTGPSGSSGNPGGLDSSVAWPTDGIASYPVLESLAANKITTVVLDSTTMPPVQQWPYTPSAVTSTPDGVRGAMKVLLSDDTITKLLGTANSPSAPAGARFAVEQRYLAETAMIAAEAPQLPRAIVVAPPRHWDPPASLASRVLAETVSAPWLRPISLGQLAAAGHAPGRVARSRPTAVSRDELSGAQLRRLSKLEGPAQALDGIRLKADPSLDYAIAGAESSVWRGRYGAQMRRLIGRISGYIASQQDALTVIGQPRVTLGGLNGTVPVSISNRLGYPVRVRLAVSVPPDSGVTLRSRPAPVVVPADTVITIKLGVRASSVGSTTLGLSLRTQGNAQLPGKPVRMTIQATHYGTLALVIIAAALGIFMLTSATRAIRRDRRADEQPDRQAEPGNAGNVVADRGDPAAASADHDSEETDEYAWSPGWADRQ